MAKKKNPLAAGQERARERAKRKARYVGPAPAPSAAPVAATVGTPAEDAEQPVEAADVALAPTSPAASVSQRPPARVAAPGAAQRRRAAQSVAVAGPRLRSELLRIGVVAGIVGAALAAIQFGTTLGG